MLNHRRSFVVIILLRLCVHAFILNSILTTTRDGQNGFVDCEERLHSAMEAKTL